MIGDLAKDLDASVKSFPDFPKAGILFKDIMPIFLKPNLVDRLCKFLANEFRGKVDAVVALEARGFLFGSQVAIDLQVPFIPLRKRGKLPGRVISASYQKEYSEDVIELQEGVLQEGQRVVLLDDLLATGGTIGAAIELVQKSGARVTHAAFIIELTNLKGRQRIANDIAVLSVLAYD